MKLELLRYNSAVDCTLGLLYVDGKFTCYTLEDEQREVKVPGETRIPAGTYNVGIMFSGKRQHDMLEIKDVPGFEYIQIHTGNTDNDTDGCILVGDGVDVIGWIKNSIAAYNRVTPPIFEAIKRGEPVSIEIIDWR